MPITRVLECLELEREVRRELVIQRAVAFVKGGCSLETAVRKAVNEVDEKLETNKQHEAQLEMTPF